MEINIEKLENSINKIELKDENAIKKRNKGNRLINWIKNMNKLIEEYSSMIKGIEERIELKNKQIQKDTKMVQGIKKRVSNIEDQRKPYEVELSEIMVELGIKNGDVKNSKT